MSNCSLERISKQGEEGRKKINLYTRICALVLATAQAIGIVVGFGDVIQANMLWGGAPQWTTAIVVVLVGFILFRIISKEMERRRREREARLLAEQQAARERALWEAKDDGMEVTMSVEETRRMELQENAISMAKEHPEDVAMLIRTWLMEE